MARTDECTATVPISESLRLSSGETIALAQIEWTKHHELIDDHSHSLLNIPKTHSISIACKISIARYHEKHHDRRLPLRAAAFAAIKLSTVESSFCEIGEVQGVQTLDSIAYWNLSAIMTSSEDAKSM